MARGPLNRSVLFSLVFLSGFVLSRPSTVAVSAIPEASHSDAHPSNRKKSEVVLESGTHAYSNVTSSADNTIRGRVLNPAGDAMEGVCVTLLPAEGSASQRKLAFTDDKGSFEITGIVSGSYVIAANYGGPISINEPFHTVYYPNSFDREKGTVINVGAGYTLEGTDIHVPKTEPVTTIEGVVLFADGKPAAGELVFFKAFETIDDIDGNSREITDADGRFSIRILKGLTGLLYSEMSIEQEEAANCALVEKLIRDTGKTSVALQTNTVVIRVEKNEIGVELRYTFAGCVKNPRLRPAKPPTKP